LSEILHIPVDRELGERVSWLVDLRWLILGLAGVLGLVAGPWLGHILPLGTLWLVFGIAMGYNALLWVITRRLVSRLTPYASHTFLMHAQIIIDLVLLTSVLHLSGGLENPFSVYYMLPVVIGSVLVTRRASYAYATVATVLWVGLLLAEAWGLIPHYNLTGFRLPIRYREAAHIVAESFVLATANFGAAYLASSIVERLREGERQLYEANASCELRAGELAELNRRLQELDHTRSLFIRLVTHELRAPVAAIQSYLQLILQGYVPQDRLNEIIGKAEQRARDQLELIGDLLDLARLGEPKDLDKTELVDMAAVLHDVLDMMQARIQDRSQTLDVEVAPQLPCVVAQVEHVRQVWINLVSNAVKYTPEGGHITVRLYRDEEGLHGSVQDTGIGISPEEQEHIFESFYRTEAAKAMSRHGTGLGLSIVTGIMERYGGRMWLESELGKGSTFHFVLPVLEGSEAS